MLIVKKKKDKKKENVCLCCKSHILDFEFSLFQECDFLCDILPHLAFSSNRSSDHFFCSQTIHVSEDMASQC